MSLRLRHKLARWLVTGPVEVAAAEAPGAPLPRDRHQFYPKLLKFEEHPKAWTFPAYLDASQPWLAELKRLYASPMTFPASLAPEAGLLIHFLIRNIRPRTIVEIGSFLGVSTIWMAAALEAAKNDPASSPIPEGAVNGIIHCFDDFGPIPPGPWRLEHHHDEPRDQLVRASLMRAGLAHRAILHPGNSAIEVKRSVGVLSATGVDFAFIDGDHTVQGVLQDLWAVEPLLNTGGYILLHDTFPEQCGDHLGPRHIIDNFTTAGRGRYELCELYTAPLNYGMALMRRIG